MSRFRMQSTTVVPLLLAVSLAAANAAKAQTGALARPDGWMQAAPTFVDEAAADSLARAAERLYSIPADAAQAARLQLRSASLRAAGSPERLESLRMAARLAGYAGDWRQARETMQVLADELLAFGDADGAANATVDAAFMAVHEGNMREVHQLTGRARWLGTLPAVEPTARVEIMRRIDGAGR